MLQNLSVKNIYDKITSLSQQAVFWKVAAKLVIPGGQTLDLPNIGAIIYQADYMESFCSNDTIEISVDPVFYKGHMAPNKDNLEVHITFSVCNAYGTLDVSAESFITKYNLYLIDPVDIDMMTNLGNKDEAISLASSNLMKVNGMLMDPTLDHMRMMDVGGVYYNTNLQTLMQGLFSVGLENRTAVDDLIQNQVDSVRGVDIIDITNRKIYPEIIVPNKKITKLANLLQEEYGVYGAGINNYYQNGFWYIYPLYETQRFKTEDHKLSVILLDKHEAMGLESTFMRENGTVTILSTGDVANLDQSEEIINNIGDSIRFNRASDLQDNMIGMSNNQGDGKASDVQRGVSLEGRKRGNNNTFTPDNMFTDNPYKELSRIAGLKGQILRINWEHSSPGLIEPAMPVEIMYRADKETKFLDGVVMGHRSDLSPGSGKLTDKTYRYTTSILLFVKKRNSD